MKLIAVMAAALAALSAPPQDGLKLGEVVPDVTMKTTDGKEIKLSELRSNADKKTEGQIVVVYFGSPTCPGAIPADEIKRVSEPWADSKAGVKFIFIFSDGHDKDDEKGIEKYIKSKEIPCANVVDKDQKLKEHFGPKKVNTTFVLDKDGKLVYRGCFGVVKKRKIETETVADALKAAKEGKEAPKSDVPFQG